MVVVCPTVTAFEPHEFREQMERLQPFAERIHIDFMDGNFVETVSPDISQAWWPYSAQADLHLMYNKPMEHASAIIQLKPHLVIIHAEADVHHMHFAAEMHKHGIKTGLCILQKTKISDIKDMLHSFDHLLIFSGHLGHHGGKADLKLLSKALEAKEVHPGLEIGWDGGINDQNIGELIDGGVDVLNVGGFIQHAPSPKSAFNLLKNKLKS